eukprot:TRINITY_DN93295_c0_g1_i2.p1 TRINITY_DN93295_c0_g1~~TRINITY_DN93295_c0_g1_i2.p1  ORF type:complete len:346 (+),score=-32.03 TRINITY_DN93295_c0_g1_i2:114-1040(+)
MTSHSLSQFSPQSQHPKLKPSTTQPTILIFPNNNKKQVNRIQTNNYFLSQDPQIQTHKHCRLKQISTHIQLKTNLKTDWVYKALHQELFIQTPICLTKMTPHFSNPQKQEKLIFDQKLLYNYVAINKYQEKKMTHNFPQAKKHTVRFQNLFYRKILSYNIPKYSYYKLTQTTQTLSQPLKVLSFRQNVVLQQTILLRNFHYIQILKGFSLTITSILIRQPLLQTHTNYLFVSTNSQKPTLSENQTYLNYNTKDSKFDCALNIMFILNLQFASQQNIVYLKIVNLYIIRPTLICIVQQPYTCFSKQRLL